VVLTQFDERTLDLGPFYWFGSEPGKKLPSLDGNEVAKHTKANAEGVKTHRHGLRIVRLAHFAKLQNMAELCEKLFGVECDD
jgi:hypothetical protein